MLDNIVICKKLGIMAKYYTEFRQLTKCLTIDEYIKDITKRRAIEREIQLIVECATDINNMILKKNKRGPSKDYFNSFVDLGETSVLDMDFVLRIAPSTGLRNILVHEYQEINNEIVFNSIKLVLDYYCEYIQKISEYLKCS